MILLKCIIPVCIHNFFVMSGIKLHLHCTMCFGDYVHLIIFLTADNHSPVVYTAISFAICFVISVGIIVLLVIVFYKILSKDLNVNIIVYTIADMLVFLIGYYKKKAKSKPTCSCSQNPASVQL